MALSVVRRLAATIFASMRSSSGSSSVVFMACKEYRNMGVWQYIFRDVQAKVSVKCRFQFPCFPAESLVVLLEISRLGCIHRRKIINQVIVAEFDRIIRSAIIQATPCLLTAREYGNRSRKKGLAQDAEAQEKRIMTSTNTTEETSREAASAADCKDLSQSSPFDSPLKIASRTEVPTATALTGGFLSAAFETI